MLNGSKLKAVVRALLPVQRDTSLPSLEPGSIIEIYINSGYVVDVNDYPGLTVEACIVDSLQDSNTANNCDTAAY
jgi:hypothetical protein